MPPGPHTPRLRCAMHWSFVPPPPPHPQITRIVVLPPLNQILNAVQHDTSSHMNTWHIQSHDKHMEQA